MTPTGASRRSTLPWPHHSLRSEGESNAHVDRRGLGRRAWLHGTSWREPASPSTVAADAISRRNRDRQCSRMLGHWGVGRLDRVWQLPMRVRWREFVFVGFLGGFTTFSTFGLDTITLVRTGDVTLALSNVLIQVVGGLAGVYGALLLCERLGPAVH